MGRDVENYIVMKSDKVDLDKILKEYLDSILDTDDEDPRRMMVYGDSISELFVSEKLDLSGLKEIRGRRYYSKDGFLLFYTCTRRCDLEETFGEFIKPYLANLTVCKLFMRDGEAGYDFYEMDFIKDDSIHYYNDLPDSFYLDEYGGEMFILSRCGIDTPIPNNVDRRYES